MIKEWPLVESLYAQTKHRIGRLCSRLFFFRCIKVDHPIYEKLNTLKVVVFGWRENDDSPVTQKHQHLPARALNNTEALQDKI